MTDAILTCHRCRRQVRSGLTENVKVKGVDRVVCSGLMVRSCARLSKQRVDAAKQDQLPTEAQDTRDHPGPQNGD